MWVWECRDETKGIEDEGGGEGGRLETTLESPLACLPLCATSVPSTAAAFRFA